MVNIQEISPILPLTLQFTSNQNLYSILTSVPLFLIRFAMEIRKQWSLSSLSEDPLQEKWLKRNLRGFKKISLWREK